MSNLEKFPINRVCGGTLGYDALPGKLKEMVAAKKITASQAIDVFTKFPEKKCLEFARALADIPTHDKKKRKSMGEALRMAKKSDSLADIRKRAKSMENSV